MKEFDIPVEQLVEDIRINVVDTEDFNSRVVPAYENGTAEKGLEADDQVARSVVPAGQAGWLQVARGSLRGRQHVQQACVVGTRLQQLAEYLARLGGAAVHVDQHRGVTDLQVAARLARVADRFYAALAQGGAGFAGEFAVSAIAE